MARPPPFSLVSILLISSAAAAPPECRMPNCSRQRYTQKGNHSPRAARRHLATNAQCAYRADPRHTAGTVEALQRHQREGAWCRLPHFSSPRGDGDWVEYDGERYFLPLKWAMPHTSYYLAPAAFSKSPRCETCTERTHVLVRVWGCIVARCWHASHMPVNSSDPGRWPAGTFPTHV